IAPIASCRSDCILNQRMNCEYVSLMIILKTYKSRARASRECPRPFGPQMARIGDKGTKGTGDKGTKGTSWVSLPRLWGRRHAIVIIRSLECAIGPMPGAIHEPIAQHALQDFLEAPILTRRDTDTLHNVFNFHGQSIFFEGFEHL